MASLPFVVFVFLVATPINTKKYDERNENAKFWDDGATISFPAEPTEDKEVKDTLEIEELEKSNIEHPEYREAHKTLAREIITFLHGKEEYERAINLADHLFNKLFRCV